MKQTIISLIGLIMIVLVGAAVYFALRPKPKTSESADGNPTPPEKPKIPIERELLGIACYLAFFPMVLYGFAEDIPVLCVLAVPPLFFGIVLRHGDEKPKQKGERG